MKKSAFAIRHVSFEDLACFEQPLEARGYELRYFDAGVDDLNCLKGSDADLLTILGGPLGACEEDIYPFLLQELRIIQEWLQIGRPLIGICLSAQLIARVLGSKVYSGPRKEIGFAPITLTADGKGSCLQVFDEAPVLHWHGDTFDLPDGATLLASTLLCRNQAYSLGANVIGFQFHPEGVATGFERWLIGHACELNTAGIDPVQLRNHFADLKTGLQQRASLCLESWLNSLDPLTSGSNGSMCIEN